MAFGSKVHNAIYVVLREDAFYKGAIGDITLDEGVIRTRHRLADVGKVARIGELVERDDVIVGILRGE